MAMEIRNLKESNHFLNILLDNIPSAVFIVDKTMKIHSVNDAFQKLFRNSVRHDLTANPFGNVMGCKYAVEENRPCGTTSHCHECALREFSLRAFTEKTPVYRQKLSREFYVGDRPELKHVQFTTKYIVFHGQEMVLIIIDDITEIENQRIALDQDIQAAARIQHCLLPSALPKFPNIDLAWQFEPCQKVGGDIFNVMPLDDHHLGFYVVDVSGHGVPSALIAVAVSQALQPYGGHLTASGDSDGDQPRVVSPETVVRELDREFPLERFNNYFTIAYLVLDTRSGLLRYCSAGHPVPYIVRRDGGPESLKRGGAVIGMDSLIPFHEQRVRLAPGDKIILYTDGIIEHQNPSGEMFGSKRLLRALHELKDLPVSRITEEILQAVKSFGGPCEPEDDITLLAAEYQGPTADDG